MRADSTWLHPHHPRALRLARSRAFPTLWPARSFILAEISSGGGGQTAPRDCGRGNRPQGSHFCNSVQIAVWYSSALPVQVVTNLPLSLNSAGVTISGAVFMSSGMKASDPAMPFA